jgi:hypothetical protein
MPLDCLGNLEGAGTDQLARVLVAVLIGTTALPQVT